MIRVNDKWLRILLSAIPSILFLYDFLVSESATLQANVVYIATVILVCEGSRYLFYQSLRWYTPPFKKLKRLITLIPLGVLWVSVLFIISKAVRNYWAYGEFGIDGGLGSFIYVNNKELQLGLIGMSILYGMLIFFVLLGIYELAYHLARLRHTERERDRLEKEKLQAELQQLKGIVNPHFLFNNLNSLSSLIAEDPSQAENFLDELTKVFRYLLRNNEIELTTLEQELRFMDSYYHLLQTRYGRGVSLKIEIEPQYESWLLPPLTLQLLVENAVKHNQVQKDNPLHIEIFTQSENRLVVRNNLLARNITIESTGIGLRSINSRYKLLDQESPSIYKSDEHFFVSIPLIPPSTKGSKPVKEKRSTNTV